MDEAESLLANNSIFNTNALSFESRDAKRDFSKNYTIPSFFIAFKNVSDVPLIVKRELNENGLCKTEADVARFIPYLDHGVDIWEPCYVYRVIC